MDAFSYLSVLLSIILGLAITQVLKGFRGLMQTRSRLRPYWPAVAWAILVLVIAVQSWWAMFGLRQRVDWTFFEFSVVLAQTIVVYLLAALVLPDFFGDATVDLREHYYANHRWFFALAVLLIVISVGKEFLLAGRMPEPLNLGFQATFATLSAGAVSTRNARYHELATVTAAIGIGAYIGVLFTHLG
ncbi:hypothetical protein [Dokdonella soli]|uniref:Uncharacterized protein n=1 Tax=Dokdonella soli TaxID=529810 RepID=A0ABN1ILH7_9GAMM